MVTMNPAGEGGRKPLSIYGLLMLGLMIARHHKEAREVSREQPRSSTGRSAAGPGTPPAPTNDAGPIDTPHEAARVAAAEPERGRTAAKPTEIPASGWKDIAMRTIKEIGEDDVMSVARSIAFSGMLALFPALAAFVSIYGLFADVNTAREHLAALTGIVPADAMTFLGDQIVRLAAQKNSSLSLTFVLGLVLSIWSANAGMKALFKGLNIAYEEEEKRKFIQLNLVTLAFTFGAILFVPLAIAAMIVVPILFNVLGLGGAASVLALLRWPALLAITAVGLSLLYRYGPSRDKPAWRWVSWGSGVAALIWLAASVLFSWYLSNFADYNKTYGSLGAVFGFMMWLWLSAVVVLIGAELNSEMEHQTARDTTEGPEAPLGARGAEMADTVGEAQKGSIIPKMGKPRGA